MASTGISIRGRKKRASGLGNDFPAVVRSAGRADGMGPFHLLALRAGAAGGIDQFLVSPAFVPAALRAASFRIRHRLLLFFPQGLQYVERPLPRFPGPIALRSIPVRAALRADSAAILPAEHLGRKGERHLLPEDVRHLDPRPVVKGDIEVSRPKLEVPGLGGAPGRRAGKRLKLPLQPEGDGLRAAAALAFPLGGEGPAPPPHTSPP